jgi:hypothetical protein
MNHLPNTWEGWDRDRASHKYGAPILLRKQYKDIIFIKYFKIKIFYHILKYTLIYGKEIMNVISILLLTYYKFFQWNKRIFWPPRPGSWAKWTGGPSYLWACIDHTQCDTVPTYADRCSLLHKKYSKYNCMHPNFQQVSKINKTKYIGDSGKHIHSWETFSRNYSWLYKIIL